MLSASGRSQPGLPVVGTRNRTALSRRAGNRVRSHDRPAPGIPYAALYPCRAILALADPSRSAQRSTLLASWATSLAAPGPAGIDHGPGTGLPLLRAPQPLGDATRACPSRARVPPAGGRDPEPVPNQLLRR